MLKESTTETLDEQKTPTIEHQIESANERLFWKVIQAYRKHSRSLDGCEQTGRRMRRTSIAEDFVDDVESATGYALQGTCLIDDWFCLIQGVLPRTNVKELLIGLCGPVYRVMGLAPDYFKEKGSIWKHLYEPSELLWDTRVCERHGVQTVAECFKDCDGYAMQLDCGCNSRPARELGIRMAALPTTSAHSIKDTASMAEEHGTAA